MTHAGFAVSSGNAVWCRLLVAYQDGMLWRHNFLNPISDRFCCSAHCLMPFLLVYLPVCWCCHSSCHCCFLPLLPPYFLSFSLPVTQWTFFCFYFTILIRFSPFIYIFFALCQKGNRLYFRCWDNRVAMSLSSDLTTMWDYVTITPLPSNPQEKVEERKRSYTFDCIDHYNLQRAAGDYSIWFQ